MQFRAVIPFCVLFLGSVLPISSHAQFQAPSKEELEMTSDPQAPGAPAVYLYREERHDDPHHFRSVYARIKVLTEAGKEASTVHVVYAKRFVFSTAGTNSSRMGSGVASHWDVPSLNHAGEDRPWDTDTFVGHVEVAAIEGRVIHPDGTIVPLTGSPADLLKVKQGSAQYNEMTFTLPSVEVGSILEYRYQVRYDRYQQAPEWQIQQPYFIHKAHFLFIPAEQFGTDRGRNPGLSNASLLAANGEILTDIRAAAVLPPGKAVQANALNQYVLDLTDIPAIPQEPYSPPLASSIYRVSFYYIYTPDERGFWQKEMSWWMRDVNAYTAPTPLLRRTVDETCAPADTPLDKAKKLYALVQKLENTDGGTNATSGLIPAGSVERVLQDKRGTGKEIAFLYLALARVAGLDARPVRITARDQGSFNPSFLSTDQLNAMVVGLAVDGKQIVADPGVKAAPFQTLYWAHAGAAGVAMDSGKVETLVTPVSEPRDNTTVRVGTLRVNNDGAISGTLRVGFTGQQAIQLRQLAIRTGADAIRGELDRTLAAQVPEGTAIRVDRIANLDDTSKQLVALVTVSGTLGARTGGKLILPRLFFETHVTNPYPELESRTLPVDVPYPAEDEEQITYAVPDGFALEGKPEDTIMKWDGNVAYQMRSKVDATSVTTARVLARTFTLLPADQYKPLRDFYQKIVVADRQELALSGRQSAHQ